MAKEMTTPSHHWRTVAQSFKLKPLTALVLGTFAFQAHAQSNAEWVDLGSLGGGYSIAFDISSDGNVVVGGSATRDEARYHAFRWENNNMQDLGTLPGHNTSEAIGVSPNGKVVVGESWRIQESTWDSIESRAFRWKDGVMTDLGTLGGSFSAAADVSADGKVVVGASLIAENEFEHAFRWVEGAHDGISSNPQMFDLGTLEGHKQSRATGVSHDGSVVVGTSWDEGDFTFDNIGDASIVRAFRWTATDNKMQDLGTLGGARSWAFRVSADGNVVVGASDISDSSNTYHAFRWVKDANDGVSSNPEMYDLGTLGGNNSEALNVSDDGSVVVGSSETPDGSWRAFRWTEKDGMESVAAWLSKAGVSVPNGAVLTEASGVSADGNVIVGTSATETTKKAWLARVSSIGSGLITDIPAFQATLVETGTRSVQGSTSSTNLALFGAHHRTILDSGLARTQDGACAWATADAAHHNASDTRIKLAEAGVCKDFGSLRLGAAVGKTWSNQDWDNGGSAEYDGRYLYIEAANAFSNGIEASLSAFSGRFDTKLRRRYQNGAQIDTSFGNPDAKSTALRVRLDWKDLAKASNLSISPYIAYTWVKTKLDAYTETGGGFPASYDAAKWKTSDIRFGVTGKTSLSQSTDLNIGIEAVHRIDESASGVSGEVIGLGTFSLASKKLEQNWARITADIDHHLSKNTVFTFGANAGSEGNDASWGITAGLRTSF